MPALSKVITCTIAAKVLVDTRTVTHFRSVYFHKRFHHQVKNTNGHRVKLVPIIKKTQMLTD